VDPPDIDNRTDFIVHPQLLLDREGEKLAAIVKATFEGDGGDDELTLAPEARQRAMRFADVPWGEPEKSSIAYPSDLCLRKPGTDVIFVAKAYAPSGQPVPWFDVYAQVGSLRKALRVHGLRVWEAAGAGLSAPRPIAELELRYDHAWGGMDDSDPAHILVEPRNPVGLGLARDPNTLTHRPAPSIEDPAQPIASHRTRPPPAGIGAIGRHWEPRRHYLGTYDALWREYRAPLPPEDQDDHFNHCASPGLIADPALTGGERVALLNLLPGGGATRFTLPKLNLGIEFHVAGRQPTLAIPHLDTVLIDLMQLGEAAPITVELVWRASVRPPRKLRDARIVVRELEAL
jgi:hypothetical protein